MSDSQGEDTAEGVPSEEGEVTDQNGPSEPGDPLEYAREDALDLLEGLLDAMDVEGDVEVEILDGGLDATIHGEDVALLIGREGATLAALQELLRASVQHQAGERMRVNLDIEGYRRRRREALERQAVELAERVAREGGEIALEPMSAFERKVVHDAVSGVEGATSASEGEEPSRRVVIRAG